MLTNCKYSIRLIKGLKELDDQDKINFSLVDKAIYWAKKYHGDQKRKSGEPFYTHPLEVAYMVSEYNLKTDVIVTAILHDIVEDTEVTVGMIVDHFGWRIAEMVDRLTRDRPDGTKLSVRQILSNAYEQDDKEVLLIKIVDRLHNLQTINVFSAEKQQQQIQETCDSLYPGYTVYLEIPKLEKDFFIALKKSNNSKLYLECYNVDLVTGVALC